jgi:hypothetical protein
MVQGLVLEIELLSKSPGMLRWVAEKTTVAFGSMKQ